MANYFDFYKPQSFGYGYEAPAQQMPMYPGYDTGTQMLQVPQQIMPQQPAPDYTPVQADPKFNQRATQQLDTDARKAELEQYWQEQHDAYNADQNRANRDSFANAGRQDMSQQQAPQASMQSIMGMARRTGQEDYQQKPGNPYIESLLGQF